LVNECNKIYKCGQNSSEIRAYFLSIKEKFKKTAYFLSITPSFDKIEQSEYFEFELKKFEKKVLKKNAN